MSPCTLIVGAGLYGAACARELHDAGHRVHVIEQRPQPGGNCATRYVAEADCHEHLHGAHIFHTDSDRIWTWVNRFARFNGYVNRVKVRHGDALYSFPINLFTLYQVFGAKTPDEARAALARERQPIAEPANLEEHCLATVGPTLYRLFIEGYTRKQWGRHPSELPAEIIKRIPVRLDFNDNYFNDRWQGIPIGGYAAMFDRLLAGIRVDFGVDFLRDRDHWLARYDRVIYTGPIDAFFDHVHGRLEYRSLRFERELLPIADFQGNAVVNYTDAAVPYTRIVEHRHFDLPSPARNERASHTLITREYPAAGGAGAEPYYPVATAANQARFERYRALADELAPQVHFGGRLAEYRYYDMHQVIGAALAHVQRRLHGGCHRIDALTPSA
ncbi:MAG TPA: UDP-galactopyranose mutase [Ideonella sp.]|uniref:UDP-galactopyranose mutase n=1 Tax=Ideonella sp. TaxID=1929293 RepID=UPI002E2FCE6C|nr:UDP-galactopyranose mutase [Ideonella sp.]HEX5682707.1 UDP-galactopyranose mutase [Ideonella sp.]